MKRKQIVAILAALSLLFSGVPVSPVRAEQLPDTAQAMGQEDGGEEIPAVDPAGDMKEDTGEAEGTAPAGEEEGPGDGGGTAEGTGQEATAVGTPVEETETDSQDDGEMETGTAGLDTEDKGTGASLAAGDARMAGSNGILYDGVAYLSARNVLAMDEETQEAYRALCDDIAMSRDSGLEMQDVVLAVDAEGDLYCSYYVPMRALEAMQAEFLPDAEGSLSPTAEGSIQEDAPDDSRDPQEDEAADSAAPAGDKDVAGEEPIDGSAPADSQDTADDGAPDGKDTADGEVSDSRDITDGETSDDGAPADGQDTTDGEEPSAGTDTPDGDTEDDGLLSGDTAAAYRETADDGFLPGDAGTADGTVDNGDTDGGQSAGSGEVFEENLDRISFPEGETFEPVEPARVESTLDLGYGAISPDGPEAGRVQPYSVLPKDNYFEAQLTSVQKRYYKAAEKELITGYSWFSFQESLSVREAVSANVAHAVSALILGYPDRTDWMAKPGGFHGRVQYKSKAKKGFYTFIFDVSDYYEAQLNIRAKARIQEIGNEAVAYAAENYPDAPVYGIVEYYDQWLCGNGYYENIGAKAAPAEAEKETYYYCHSAYGMLLNGYGVCESYSKAMARLLDAAGIPNIYAVGQAGDGGHTWNYIQMPDGKWYVQDSTWNDTADPAHTASDRMYFLKEDTGEHQATGCIYADETASFRFPQLSSTGYSYEAFGLDKDTCDLVPRETLQLTCTRSAAGCWTSSNPKAAKVDKTGKVTAVAGGMTVVTFAGQGLTASCVVNVDQVKAVRTADSRKTSEDISLGIAETQKDAKDILLAVDMGASPHTAQWLLDQGKVAGPEVINSRPEVASASVTVADNKITVHIQAQAAGTTNVTVKFGGKNVKIKVSAGQVITADMFDVTWPAGVVGTDGSRTISYTGKAVRPVIKKKADEAYKPVKFKVAYFNNKDAGNAKAVITGTGKYGGTIEYPFTITPVDITDADFTKALKGRVYNGGSNPPAATVKLGTKTLKAGRDYEILYTREGLDREKADYLPVGSYTVTIRGTGNYTGEVKATQPYQVTQNTIAKVTVSGASSAKHTGIANNPYTVRIGKNVLPSSDYDIVWYLGQGKTKRSTPMVTPPIARGKYTAVITVKGNNLTTTAKKKEIVKKFTIK